MALFQIKKNLTADRRYDAVGSSSLREELFNTYIKAGASEEGLRPQSADSTAQPTAGEDEEERERRRKERKERAVKEREEKVRAERTKVEAEIDRSKLGLTKEEGELEFRCAFHFSFRDPLPGATHRGSNGYVLQDNARRCHPGPTGMLTARPGADH